MDEAPFDWQLGCTTVKQRGGHLLQSGQWSDCTFLVGTKPHQVMVSGHKLILAMASPVFEAMFFGNMAEINYPIPILDVQPDAFKALLEYIYTDNISKSSFENACELCYAAKKYMLPHVVKECTRYLLGNLSPKNACRAYEFARLFEENELMDKSIQIISTNTIEVLNDSSFEEVELNTVITVFSLDHLNINNELDLFKAAVRYAKAHDTCEERSAPGLSGEEDKDAKDKPTVRSAIEKIRFLTVSAQQFSAGPAASSLLSESEAFAVLMNILSNRTLVPMPQGFSTSREYRKKLIGGGSSKSMSSSAAAARGAPPAPYYKYRFN